MYKGQSKADRERKRTNKVHLRLCLTFLCPKGTVPCGWDINYMAEYILLWGNGHFCIPKSASDWWWVTYSGGRPEKGSYQPRTILWRRLTVQDSAVRADRCAGLEMSNQVAPEAGSEARHLPKLPFPTPCWACWLPEGSFISHACSHLLEAKFLRKVH